ncbi:cob(I)yrinic acid a,c-diamide adenosyltransferase [Sporolactobacillus sp. THM19-2]|uniref:cob(I)yrinic acid a,c-diamide adenosyltransferase n=1 Tax=Sporolactobacillus sp. THM19-2 TaxID=2511171 RepID=UPI0010227E94|nr:cob(I)yrinic acid a,c-diamide adenosyltransferase [Sporolactobacillus sp. THM19-2]RYL88131.1 cob(I)yrinic acid a,c-diamide adenosyltransferase [Sporolactobacillus sp. THM19-2]
MKIYTGHGDLGKTNTLSGARPLKSSPIIQLNGSMDEVSASIGYLSSQIHRSLEEKQNFEGLGDELKNLIWIQNAFYHMGIEVSSNFSRIYIDKSHVSSLESKIDLLDQRVDPLTEFILYSGSTSATYAQITRAIVRRCERDYVALLSSLDTEVPQSYIFINRVSDYFFQLSRYLNKRAGMKEEIVTKWELRKKY